MGPPGHPLGRPRRLPREHPAAQGHPPLRRSPGGDLWDRHPVPGVGPLPCCGGALCGACVVDALTYEHVGQVATFWLCRNIGCFTRDIMLF